MLMLIQVLLLFFQSVHYIHGDVINFSFNGAEGKNEDAYENSVCVLNGTESGTCQYVKNCPAVVEALEKNKRPVTCGFDGHKVLVCCESRKELEGSTNETLGLTKLNSQCKINGTQNGICQYAKNCPAVVEDLQNLTRPVTCGFDGIYSECTINGTETGTCQYVKNCPEAFSDLQVNARPDTCGYDRNKLMVCCASKRELNESTKLGISELMCKQYESQLCRPDFLIPPVVSLIIVGGGTDSDPAEFPHMAAIGYGSRKAIEWLCGGSLISDRYVLSAAHCIHVGSRFGKPRWVRLGDLNIRSDNDNARPEDFEIVQHIVHPDYNAPQVYNDIALFKLDRLVIFNAYIKPVCLHRFYQIPSSKGVATGWGRLGHVHQVSDILQKVELTFVPARVCSASLNRRSVQLTNGIDSKSMVCAGEEEGVKDTCQGDSGGPLSIRGKKCIPKQVGITSVGPLCGLPNSPGIYTRIAHFVPWIESIVWLSG